MIRDSFQRALECSSKIIGAGTLACLLTMSGCSEPASMTDPTAETTDGTCDDACGDSTDSAATTGVDPTSTSGVDGDSGSATTSGGEAGGVPCDVVDVVERNCLLCHDEPTSFGAPMPLLSLDDWRVPAASDPTLSVAEMVDLRIEDMVDPMPEGGLMDEDDRDVLHAWIAAGTPADPAADCEPGEDTDTGGPDGDGVGVDDLPCEPSHTFLAHASGSEEPYHVPAQGADNLYMCFTFSSPFAAGTQATAWAPIIDDERVIHHWILFNTATDQPDGGVGPCNMPQDATFVAGWAPGGQNFVMPDDVGLRLGDGAGSFILQVHYHNTDNHPDAFDASGVAMCTTPTPRPSEAGVITLGTVNINIPAGAEGATEVGVCPSAFTSLLPFPLHALSSFPHMHNLGRAFNTEITRTTGETVDLVDVPSFSFDNQLHYPHDPEIDIFPGDTLTTTCTYDNPYDFNVGFGEATEDEMCFNFVMVYPVNGLPGGPPVCSTG